MKIFKNIEHNSPSYWESIELRDQLLRKPLGLTFKTADLEAEKDSIHLGGYTGEKLMCCLVLKPLSEKLIKMRQVAVADEAQGKGWGSSLVLESERLAQEKGFETMMCHARESAVPFYLKLDYAVVGERFEEVSIPHFKMEKKLTIKP